MCGLAGTFSFRGRPVDKGLLAAMGGSMAHRGPDGSGLWLSEDGKVGLAHRRLSILDLSESAAQPMASADGNLHLVFNGEIYNHADVRSELESLGRRRWRTDHSDTEVILQAFEQWGIECLHKFRGMFAFALWDGRRRELFLVRDRIGVKPLYYAFGDGKVSFASEIKALLADPEQRRELDETAFYHFLSFIAVPAPDTLFAGVRKLPPATWMRVSSDGGVTSRRYWDALDNAGPLNLDEDETAERLLAELRTSVRLRKVSDVPVGVFLSGGIDSSTNVALFSEGEKGEVKTFSIGYEGHNDSNPSELPYAREVAEKFGARHHEKVLNLDDLLSFLPAMVRHQDEPIADPVCVPVYYVSKLARENGVTVCQVGEGADELFCGYPAWRKMIRLQEMNDWPVPGALKRLGLGLLRAGGRDRDRSYEWLRRGSEGEPVFWSGAEAFTETEKRRILSPRLRERFKGYSSYEALRPVRKRFMEKSWEKSPLQWMAYADLNLRLPELLLMRVDKMTMAAGLEGRVPFLDHKFVELALSIPQSLKLKGGVLKHILKKSVAGLLPRSVLDRPKQGFGVPVHEWLLGRLGGRVREELEGFCRRTDFLDRREVMGLFDRKDPPLKLWPLFNLALWWREFMEGARPEPTGARA